MKKERAMDGCFLTDGIGSGVVRLCRRHPPPQFQPCVRTYVVSRVGGSFSFQREWILVCVCRTCLTTLSVQACRIICGLDATSAFGLRSTLSDMAAGAGFSLRIMDLIGFDWI